MNTTSTERAPIAIIPALPEPWPAVIGSYLAETHLWGGSVRTPIEYARILGRFFALFPDPSEVAPIGVHSFAYGRSPGADQPAASTICVRLAAISGLYEFARRVGAIDRNPAADIRRPRPAPSLPRGLATDELQRLLAVIPSNPAGQRDRAIILLILLTGLRRSEVFSLTVGDVDFETGDYIVRVKGGRERRRRIPAPALEAILAALQAEGRAPAELSPDAPLFTVSGAGFYASLRRYAASAGLAGVCPHVLRHMAAKLRRHAGASVEEVSALLGHASIATTATYLRRIDTEPDEGWRDVARALGVGGSIDLARGSAASSRLVNREWRPRTPAPMAWTPLRPRPAIWNRPDGRANARPAHATGGQASVQLSKIDSSGP